MRKSTKNYLLVPLKLDGERAYTLAYSIDVESVLSFTDRCSDSHTLNNLSKVDWSNPR